MNKNILSDWLFRSGDHTLFLCWQSVEGSVGIFGTVSSVHWWPNLLVSAQQAGTWHLFPSALCVVACQWPSPSVHLVTFFCRFSLPDSPLFYQGRSETHGVLWQLFKQPRSLSKGRCLHWSESCLFSSGRCFPPQARAGTKMLFYQKHEVGNRRSRVAKHTTARCWVCACVCMHLHITVVAKLSESCDNRTQMFESPCVVMQHLKCSTWGCGEQKTETLTQPHRKTKNTTTDNSVTNI